MSTRLRAGRLAWLLGSSSALSRPVIIGVAFTGFVLSFTYSAIASHIVDFWDAAVGMGGFLLSILLLLASRSLGHRSGWTHPRVGFVVFAIAITSLLRSLATSVAVGWHSGRTSSEVGPAARTLASLIVTVVISLILVASVQLAHERAEATSHLRSEQRRLTHLAESMDAELIRADRELRARALALLEPTIDEIATLIGGAVSESAARQVSERIVEVVNDVVRPASRDLAISPLIEVKTVDIDASPPPHLLADRMDVTKAIKPLWLLLLSWGILLPGPLLLGVRLPVVAMWFGISVIIALVLLAIKSVWPRSLRTLPVPVGLVVLFGLYLMINIGLQALLSRWGQDVMGLASWTHSNGLGVTLRVGLAMLVSILATLHLHGEQIRSKLFETNTHLKELISRLQRETWLLHRSVSLTIHGTVQSALVSTAMRLTAPNPSPETVEDARRRLNAALAAISSRQEAASGVGQALQDLQDIWHSLVRIDFDVSPAADALLTADMGMRQCIVEICREATSNAIRHGQAKAIAIQIQIVGSSIEICVDDDGHGEPASATPGLGSMMLDDTCLRWSLQRRAEGGSRLFAVVV